MLRHILEVDGLAVLARHPNVAIPSIVAEAVLNTDNDPVRIELEQFATCTGGARLRDEPNAHQRFVNTTPKPSATKKSSGDEPCPLPFPFPFPFPLLFPLLASAGDDVGPLMGVVKDGTSLEEARVGSADEVAEEMALVVACLISCWRVRTAMLARPARSRLSKGMANRESPGSGPTGWGFERMQRLSVVVVVGLRAYGARLSDRGAAATDSEVN